MKNLDGKVIFHIGNVANNAYNAAAFDRSKNITSFAISPDYLHVMAFPFWETEEITVEPKNAFHPEVFMTSANMPEWFVHGSWSEIYQKLILLLKVQDTEPIQGHNFILQSIKLRDVSISYLLKKTRHLLKKILPNKTKHWLANTLLVKLRKPLKLGKRQEDIYYKIFNLADVVVFYGAFNAYASISKWNGDYISLEHGTLRDYINSDFYLAQKSKESYIKSFRTIVTNQDCYKPALELGIMHNKIIKSPHPSSDFDFDQLRELRRNVLNQKLNEIFSATRHSHGSIVDRGKGNEIAIEGIFKSLMAFPHLRATFVEWGDDVMKSKKIIRDLNLADRIEWVGVLSRKALKIRMVNSFVVLDQFTVPAFGGIAADCIGLGVPIITLQNLELDLEFFGSSAPILPAKNSSEIFQHITSLVENKIQTTEIFNSSISWYDNNLSSKIAYEARLASYTDLLEHASNGINK